MTVDHCIDRGITSSITSTSPNAPPRCTIFNTVKAPSKYTLNQFCFNSTVEESEVEMESAHHADTSSFDNHLLLEPELTHSTDAAEMVDSLVGHIKTLSLDGQFLSAHEAFDEQQLIASSNTSDAAESNSSRVSTTSASPFTSSETHERHFFSPIVQQSNCDRSNALLSAENGFLPKAKSYSQAASVISMPSNAPQTAPTPNSNIESLFGTDLLLVPSLAAHFTPSTHSQPLTAIRRHSLPENGVNAMPSAPGSRFSAAFRMDATNLADIPESGHSVASSSDKSPPFFSKNDRGTSNIGDLMGKTNSLAKFSHEPTLDVASWYFGSVQQNFPSHQNHLGPTQASPFAPQVNQQLSRPAPAPSHGSAVPASTKMAANLAHSANSIFPMSQTPSPTFPSSCAGGATNLHSTHFAEFDGGIKSHPSTTAHASSLYGVGDGGRGMVGGGGGSIICYLVQFSSGRTDTYFIPHEAAFEVKVDDYVVVEADRGEDLGRVIMDNINVPLPRRNSAIALSQPSHCHLDPNSSQSSFFDVEDLNGGGGGFSANGPAQPTTPLSTSSLFSQHPFPKKIYRVAQAVEVVSLMRKIRDEVNAVAVGQFKVREWKLPMSIIDAEYQWFEHSHRNQQFHIFRLYFYIKRLRFH